MMNWLSRIMILATVCLVLGWMTVPLEAAPPPGNKEKGQKCTNGVDDDGDGPWDCDDTDCLGHSYCATAPTPTETSCTDGIDNEPFGATDCDDPDCSGDPACNGGGGGTFTAIATVTQTFLGGCVRTDIYALSGCTTSNIRNECTGILRTSGDPAGTCGPAPGASGEMQTGLWDVSFQDTYPNVNPITNVTQFYTRQFATSFASTTLATNDYGKGRNPKLLGAEPCASVDASGAPVSNPVLPLDPGETFRVVCDAALVTESSLNLRKGGGFLDEHLLTLDRLTITVTRDIP